MANIAIVNYCNLKCPYCFAEDMIKENNAFMSLEQYDKLLDFIIKDPQCKIGILGGEPTLHPNLIDILNRTKEKCIDDRNIVLFTNGIELKKFIPYLDRISILINYNNPKDLTDIQKQKLQESLDALYELNWIDGKKVKIGCNIHLGCSNYDFLWQIIDKYNIKIIRSSVVSPGGIYANWRNKKDEYFMALKPIYLDFCKKAIEHNCRLDRDCSQIPLCYFGEEELEIVEQVSNIPEYGCSPFCPCALDFTVNSKATSCFGAYYPIDYDKFTNPKSLTYYLYNKQNKPLTKLNNTGKCATCEQHANDSCQGGCLAFANRPE